MPANFGYGGDFKGEAWLMLGNGPDDTVFPGFQGAGDCFWAGSAHEEMEAAKNAGRPIPPFSGKTIVDQYAAYTASANNGQGYDPQTGANDNGTDPQQGLAWRQTTGLLDDNGVAYKIGQFVALAPGNLDELWEAAYVFGNVGIGIQLQQAQMDQFDAQQPWDYVAGSQGLGGHYVPVVGRASVDNSGLITWAERHGFTRAFYTNCNDEAYAYIDPERYNAVTGEAPGDYTDQDLEKFIGAFAQQQAANA
ncbi:MAG: hypothetical protein ACLP0J_23730 [Solirubrobacteraceae bacterium]